MDALRLKPRLPVEEQIESWDDGDFDMDGGHDIGFRSPSTQQHISSPKRRDSQSSVMSLRSELESLPGEETQVHLPGDDEHSTQDAIAAAVKAGIPIPHNVPSTALMGGTIKRLGGRKIKKIIQEDWENDLEIPESTSPLHIKPQDASQFPDSLRQVSGSLSSPTKSSNFGGLPTILKDNRRESTTSLSSVLSGATNLEKFRDNDEDEDDFFGDGPATLKMSKTRPSKPISLITPPTPQKLSKTPGLDDDFEVDFELPSDGKLKLSTRRSIPKTPSHHNEDTDWGEGSLGTRFGGTRRDGRSNRSSSASALSPSVSSSFTAESEDDTFEGLVLPTGRVDFEQRLRKQRVSRSPVRSVDEASSEVETPQPEADRDDFLAGLDIGDGDVFDAGKLTLHRNIRVNPNRPASPTRPKTSVSLTFTNKTVQSRLPRPSHERAQSTLEPVSESGGPIVSRQRKSLSRVGHISHSSLSSLPTPTTPTTPQLPQQPVTPRRGELGTRTSTTSLRTSIEPTTTSAQLLRFKRSLPAMRTSQPPPPKGPVSRFDRPPSRTESGRPLSGMRPKTPVERVRSTVDSTTSQSRKPFLPGGSAPHSQQLATKGSRTFRRHDSENSFDLRPNSRAFSRTAMRSPSPHRSRHISHLSIGSARGEYYQVKSKKYGDGHELDAFDDLPTSSHTEARYTRPPAKAPLRNKIYQNVMPDRTNSPSPVPPSPARLDGTPRFARDTAASRIARETSLAQRAPSNGPLATLTTQRVSQLSSRNNYSLGTPQPSVRSKKHRKPAQLKPHLITNMNKDNSSRHEKGMVYNPQTQQWEGNENALNVFDPPASSPSTLSMPPHLLREKENSTPRPALISNVSGTKAVQVVGGMVFDPQNMCWLKLGSQTNQSSSTNDLGEPLDQNFDDDDDDVFKDIPDLEEPAADSKEGGQGRVSDVNDDWLVGEEFDVGPEFIRRQREEEDRWRKKCDKWLDVADRDRDAWRWSIRDLLVYQRTVQ